MVVVWVVVWGWWLWCIRVILLIGHLSTFLLTPSSSYLFISRIVKINRKTGKTSIVFHFFLIKKQKPMKILLFCVWWCWMMNEARPEKQSRKDSKQDAQQIKWKYPETEIWKLSNLKLSLIWLFFFFAPSVLIKFN